MTKHLFTSLAFSAVLLVGAGCIIEPEVSDNASRPPAITIEEAGNVHEGVEGSYCYGPMCVDKITPVELLAESGLEYQAIDDERVTIKIGAAVNEMSVGMMTETGERLKCALQATRVSDIEYTATLCDDPGRYIIDVAVQFSSGGDVIYFFPIIIDPGRE